MSKSPKYVLAVLFTLGMLTELWAQSTDSVRTLKEIVVASSRLDHHSVGYRREKIDSRALEAGSSADITELLTRNSTAQVRSFGVNGIATPNIRGTGSSHTAILWNGINLQSPSSGLLDISLLPVTFVDDVSLQPGGTASLFGAGALGGVIHLGNRPRYGHGLIAETRQTFGSFGRHHQSYTLGWSKRQFHSSLRYFRHRADNDFEFYNESLRDAPRQRRQHNEFFQEGILWENYWKPGEKDQLSFRLWVQDNLLEVPTPITVTNPGNAEQEDRFNRSLFSWEHQGEHYSSTFRSALVNHTTDFVDTVTNLNSSTTYHSLVNEYELNRSLWANTTLHLGVNHTHEWLNSRNHGTDTPTRNRTALFASLRQPFREKLLVNLRVRQELVDRELTPFIPSLGLEYFLQPGLQVKATFSRNYLIPTFNQLFWAGAGGFGNPSINPELSWSQEVGMRWDHSLKSLPLNLGIEVTGYSNHVNDWILWIPVTASEWSPANIRKVWSRGLEVIHTLKLTLGKVEADLTTNYSWTRATSQEVEEEGNAVELGKQLIYTPQHTGKVHAHLTYRGYGLGWWHHMTGSQFTTGDNSPFLEIDPFGISTLVLSKDLNLGPVTMGMQFEVNNVFNKNYLVRAGYPMPLRNFKIGINTKL